MSAGVTQFLINMVKQRLDAFRKTSKEAFDLCDAAEREWVENWHNTDALDIELFTKAVMHAMFVSGFIAGVTWAKNRSRQ